MVPTRCWSRPPNFSMIRPTSTRRCLAFEICVKRFYDLDVDWQSETMVSTGATEDLAACFFDLIEPAAGLVSGSSGVARRVLGQNQATAAQYPVKLSIESI